MFLQTLRLRQFRNHERVDLELAEGLNLFVGPNGAGKSNILEAASLLCAGESPRGAEARHWIQTGREESLVGGTFTGEAPLEVEIRQRRGQARRTWVNNVPQRRAADAENRTPVVSFCPEDLELVKGEPAVRRRRLNGFLSQMDADYRATLARYGKALEERNAALRRVRDEGRPVALLEPWTASLLREGARLTRLRRNHIALWGPRVTLRHGDIASPAETLTVKYEPSFLEAGGTEPDMIEANARRLAAVREGEIAMGSTLAGPHRDDVAFHLNGSPARDFASQGQQRTAALAVTLEERHCLREASGREPLCLLDDVLSELDPDRRRRLTDSAGEGFQCLAAFTSLEEWPEVSARRARVFRVEAGVVAQDAGVAVG
jgi:DNA replication and repair protein RecF